MAGNRRQSRVSERALITDSAGRLREERLDSGDSDFTVALEPLGVQHGCDDLSAGTLAESRPLADWRLTQHIMQTIGDLLLVEVPALTTT